MLKTLIQLFIKQNGRNPNAIELLKLKFKAANQSGKGKVIEFPKDRITPFYKPRPGDVKKNVEEVYFDNPNDPRLFKPDTKKPLFKDSPERIAKIKADNKAAAERLRNKKKTVEDFRDDGDFDPGGMASGGIAGQLHLNRPGYSGGTLVKSILNLLKGAGKKKNVWRGFETKYNKDFDYPEEFSGRFFTPDKELAKWYAMRQGTLTGKVKKLKLTEEEIKAAQEFATKNLDIQYGGDLLVSKELAKKAKIDLPSTALAKIEAVIRKAKGIGPFLHKTHKQKDKINKAEGGRIGYAQGTKKPGERYYLPTKGKEWLHSMPEIDPYKKFFRRQNKLMKFKDSKGLAKILGV